MGSAGMSAALSASGSTWGQRQAQPSSDEEGSFSDHQSQGQSQSQFIGGSSITSQPSHILSIQPPSVVDPKKVILQAYLMKRSRGRGRKSVAETVVLLDIARTHVYQVSHGAFFHPICLAAPLPSPLEVAYLRAHFFCAGLSANTIRTPFRRPRRGRSRPRPRRILRRL